ncbi:hypothetical protein TREMEDRAFT_60402 [Tremella mesenterica DSM 1558]|uniref:uncharacterized protein n=1 Tax=Tremella mesenterica (strain ATCC 24925 / CBS 8224 / DSM 1558 / NBRC 9311 / NRRL Y-6157 / RJB 2259-6 / UBC 559-6) TaxID=578456 RepID=UPI0003F48E54|nr:uncharacterized protein TREMEDRAFT_60402 [Tremella mesenterica DSM 1558]EIW71475.1 hypothetical protein TREMEDRAFT_60402 [Tremella mesenterica DSM 1558]
MPQPRAKSNRSRKDRNTDPSRSAISKPTNRSSKRSNERSRHSKDEQDPPEEPSDNTILSVPSGTMCDYLNADCWPRHFYAGHPPADTIMNCPSGEHTSHYVCGLCQTDESISRWCPFTTPEIRGETDSQALSNTPSTQVGSNMLEPVEGWNDRMSTISATAQYRVDNTRETYNNLPWTRGGSSSGFVTGGQSDNFAALPGIEERITELGEDEEVDDQNWLS